MYVQASFVQEPDAAATPGQHTETPVTGHTRINHADMKSPAQQQDSACLLSVTFLPDEPQPPRRSVEPRGRPARDN
jgi:hypothetical protein